MAALFAVTALTLGWSLLKPDLPDPVQRFESPFREGQAPAGPFALTPDGLALVYVGIGESGEGTQLWIRSWDEPGSSPTTC